MLRLSAMGDVAMLIPTLYATAEANPRDSFTFLTQNFFARLVINPPKNLKVKTIDIKAKEKHSAQLLKFAIKLRKENYDYVIDLHSVIRTKLISRTLGFCSKTEVFSLKKPRKERKDFLKATPQNRKAIPQMHQLYAETIRRSGFELPETIPPIHIEQSSVQSKLQKHLPANKDQEIYRIGIAPFASTESKSYDEEETKKLISLLSEKPNYQLYLLGGRGLEEHQLKQLAQKNERTHCLIGLISLEEELQLISSLDCVISMDSANAHLAGMLGTRVVTIWTVTHPDCGFMSLGQKKADCLIPQNGLQPCSIFGKVNPKTTNTSAYRQAVPAEYIAEHINKLFHTIN